MKTLEVFDPPMCCSTGVCGSEVDSNLVRFAADLEWLKEKGVAVRRFNLSQEPKAFMEAPEVLKSISFEGSKVLPLLVLDGKIVSRHTYPSRSELTAFLGLSAQETGAPTDKGSARTIHLAATDAPPPTTSCCTPAKDGKTGCCSR